MCYYRHPGCACEDNKKGEGKLNLKNYTSSAPVINSINRIEHKLALAGATHIAKTYDGEKPVGMIFQIPIQNIPMTFKLPAKPDNVFECMKKQRNRPPKGSALETLRLQAARTAWKILSDWIDIQVSLIQVGQVEAIEVFLPYAYDGKSDQTLFEKMKENNFKQLTA